MVVVEVMVVLFGVGKKKIRIEETSKQRWEKKKKKSGDTGYSYTHYQEEPIDLGPRNYTTVV